ncbi:MAG: Bax inhibitor-1/YccA family protein [Candidatus Kapabacteria bacterium]|nr:Bax inhibitor-1/YccA family protein [Candidatus Kapabacteria bacterium]
MNMQSSQSFGNVVSTDAIRTYVQQVYAWMTGGLLITGVTAFGISQSPSILAAIFGTPLFWLVLFAPLGMVLFLTSRIDTMKPSTAAGTFIAYAFVNGLSFSVLFMIYELGSIFQVFVIAAGMFAGAAAYGFFTKRDLRSMGSFLFMGLIGVIIASVVNIFLQSSALEFAVSLIGVAVFTGLTAYDMSRMKDQAIVMYAGEGLAQKRAIIGALSLYLNFVNLFLFLLRLLGSRK